MNLSVDQLQNGLRKMSKEKCYYNLIAEKEGQKVYFNFDIDLGMDWSQNPMDYGDEEQVRQILDDILYKEHYEKFRDQVTNIQIEKCILTITLEILK